MTIFEVLGWLGTFLYLINHAYVSLVQSYRPNLYYWGNFFAALGLIFASVVLNSWQAVATNGFWAVVSLLLLLSVPIERLKLNVQWFWGLLVIALSYCLYLWIDRTTDIYQLAGWFSTLLFTASYFFFVSKTLVLRYYLLINALASALIIPQLLADQNYPAVGLQVAWFFISVIGAGRRFAQIHLID